MREKHSQRSWQLLERTSESKLFELDIHFPLSNFNFRLLFVFSQIIYNLKFTVLYASTVDARRFSIFYVMITKYVSSYRSHKTCLPEFSISLQVASSLWIFRVKIYHQKKLIKRRYIPRTNQKSRGC